MIYSLHLTAVYGSSNAVGLVLFAILFLFGARDMERRRAVHFCFVTGLLLFAWTMPIVIQLGRPNGFVFMALQLTITAIAAIALPLLFYSAGRWTRTFWMQATRA
jgi:hypothetical protein